MHFSLLSGQEYTVPGVFIANAVDDQPAAMPIAAAPAPPPGANAPPAARSQRAAPTGSRCPRSEDGRSPSRTRATGSPRNIGSSAAASRAPQGARDVRIVRTRSAHRAAWSSAQRRAAAW